MTKRRSIALLLILAIIFSVFPTLTAKAYPGLTILEEDELESPILEDIVPEEPINVEKYRDVRIEEEDELPQLSRNILFTPLGSPRGNPIEISSYADLKLNLTLINDFKPVDKILKPEYFNQTNKTIEVVRWNAGNYILTKDIKISKAQLAEDFPNAELDYGLFNIEGEFILNGNNHTIKMIDDNSPSLFNHVTTNRQEIVNGNLTTVSYPLHIYNLTLEFENNAVGTAFADNIHGNTVEDKKAIVENVKINVNGNILPIAMKSQGKLFSSGYFQGYGSTTLAHSTQAILYNNVNINIEGNIGEPDINKVGLDETAQHIMASGFFTRSTGPSSYPDKNDRENDKNKTGLWNCNLTVKGSLIAVGPASVFTSGVTYHASEPIVNTNININKIIAESKLDLLNLNEGVKLNKHNPEVTLLSRDGRYAINNQITIGEVSFKQTGDMNLVNSHTGIFCMFSGLAYHNEIGAVEEKLNNKINCGNVNIDVIAHTSFRGGESLSFRNPPKEFKFSNNTINYKDINIKSKGYIYFSGLIEPKNKGYNSTLAENFSNNVGNFGDITIETLEPCYFGGLTREYNTQIGPTDLNFGDINITSGNMRFGGITTENHLWGKNDNSLPDLVTKDINVKMGNVTLNNAGVVKKDRDGLHSLGVSLQDQDIENCHVYADSFTVSIGDIDATVGGIIGNSSTGKLNNSSVFIKDNFIVNGSSTTKEIDAGGIAGKLNGVKQNNNAVQIGGDFKTGPNTKKANLGGYSGSILGNNTNLKNNAVLIFGNLNHAFEGSIGGFVGYLSGDGTISDSGIYTGGIKSANVLSGGFAGKVDKSDDTLNGPTLSNNTVLLDGVIESNNINSKDFVNINNIVKGNFITNTLVLVSEDNRSSYPIIYNNINNNWSFVLGNKIDTVSIARRSFQEKYWEDSSNKDIGLPLTTDYVTNKGNGGNFTQVGPNAKKPIITADSSKITLNTFYDRHLSITRNETYNAENYNVTYDILGIKGNIFVTYIGNGNTGGAAPLTQVGKLNENIIIQDKGTLEREGFVFDGWNTESDGEDGIAYSKGDILTLTKNIVLYAQWKAGKAGKVGKVNVEYNGNGNTSGDVPNKVSVTIGKNITVSDKGNLEKEGYNFIGWSTNSQGNVSEYLAGDILTPKEDMILYAIWVPKNKYVISYNGNDHTSGTVPNPSIVFKGDNVTIAYKGDLDKKNNIFVGWNTEPDGSGTSYIGGQSITPTKSMTLYAQWKKIEPKKCKVSFDFNDGREPSIYTIVEIDCGSNLVGKMPEDPTSKGRTFLYWSYDKEGKNPFKPTDIITGDTIVYTVWKIDDVDIPIENIDFIIFGGPKKPILDREKHYAYLFGYPDETFRPERSMTRGEITTMFARLLVKSDNIDKFDYTQVDLFPDVKSSDWYYLPIQFMATHKIVEGYEDGTFKPDQPITRAEFAAISSRFDELLSADSNFIDLGNDHWAYGYVSSAAKRGWVSGYPDGSFKPKQHITRAEVVTIVNRMLYRCADSDFILEHQDELILFDDAPSTHWAYLDIVEATNGHDYHRIEKECKEKWERLNSLYFKFE